MAKTFTWLESFEICYCISPPFHSLHSWWENSFLLYMFLNLLFLPRYAASAKNERLMCSRVIKILTWGWPELGMSLSKPLCLHKTWSWGLNGESQHCAWHSGSTRWMETGMIPLTSSSVYCYNVPPWVKETYSILDHWMTVWRKSPSNQDHPCQKWFTCKK